MDKKASSGSPGEKRDKKEKEKKDKHDKEKDKHEHKHNEHHEPTRELAAQQVDIKQLVAECRVINKEIATLLASIDLAESTEEFKQTHDHVEQILEQILAKKTKSKNNDDYLRLLRTLAEFRNNLQKMATSGRLVKFLTSNRLRKKIEESHLQVIFILKRILTGGDALENSGGAPKTLKPSRTQVSFIDPEGQEMWAKTFGLENSLVEWNKFVRGLETFLKTPIPLKDEMCLKRIMDTTNIGLVSPFKWSQFLKGFGSLTTCIPNMKRLLSEKFFHGFLSRQEANKLLQENGQVGTFLVRFSKTQPGSFALTFNGEEHKVKAVIVESEMPRGVRIKEQGGTERQFRDLFDLLACYQDYLTRPLETPLTSAGWFAGDVSEDEAEQLLSGRLPGTYLVRMGEQPRVYFLSYLDSDGKLQHITIDRLPENAQGFRPRAHPSHSTDLPAFHDWNEWLRMCRSFLRYNYDRSGVPSFKIRQSLCPDVAFKQIGPVDTAIGDDIEDAVKAKPVDCYCVSTSGYPGTAGAWRPICDHYHVEMLNGSKASDDATMAPWSILAVADGCNWGRRPMAAAVKASDAFAAFVKAQRQNFVTTTEVGYLLAKAFSVAHDAIVEGHRDIWDAGTATLLGGVLLPLDEGKGPNDPKWGFVCASVGDCKAFVYSARTGKLIEITTGNRGGLDATDPGGRLGPFVGQGEPDLRNFKLYFCTCDEGDMVMVMSDGVHDNLDPMSLGKLPKDLGLAGAKWADVPARDVERVKDAYMVKLGEELLGKPDTPKQACVTLVNHALKITQSSRDFMIANPKLRLPSDYTQYPGKMDHTTCIAMRVGFRADPSVAAAAATALAAHTAATVAAAPALATAPAAAAPAPASSLSPHGEKPTPADALSLSNKSNKKEGQ